MTINFFNRDKFLIVGATAELYFLKSGLIVSKTVLLSLQLMSTNLFA